MGEFLCPSPPRDLFQRRSPSPGSPQSSDLRNVPLGPSSPVRTLTERPDDFVRPSGPRTPPSDHDWGGGGEKSVPHRSANDEVADFFQSLDRQSELSTRRPPGKVDRYSPSSPSGTPPPRRVYDRGEGAEEEAEEENETEESVSFSDILKKLDELQKQASMVNPVATLAVPTVTVEAPPTHVARSQSRSQSRSRSRSLSPVSTLLNRIQSGQSQQATQPPSASYSSHSINSRLRSLSEDRPGGRDEYSPIRSPSPDVSHAGGEKDMSMSPVSDASFDNGAMGHKTTPNDGAERPKTTPVDEGARAEKAVSHMPGDLGEDELVVLGRRSGSAGRRDRREDDRDRHRGRSKSPSSRDERTRRSRSRDRSDDLYRHRDRKARSDSRSREHLGKRKRGERSESTERKDHSKRRDRRSRSSEKSVSRKEDRPRSYEEGEFSEKSEVSPSIEEYVRRARKVIDKPLHLSTAKFVQHQIESDGGRPKSAFTDVLLRETVEVLEEAVRQAVVVKTLLENQSKRTKDQEVALEEVNETYRRLMKVLGLKISALDKFHSLGIKDDATGGEDVNCTVVPPPLRVEAPRSNFGEILKSRMEASASAKLIASVIYAVRNTPKLAVALEKNDFKSLINYVKNTLKVETDFVTGEHASTFLNVNGKAVETRESYFILTIGDVVVMEGSTKAQSQPAWKDAEVEAWKKFFHSMTKHDYIAVREIEQREGKSRFRTELIMFAADDKRYQQSLEYFTNFSPGLILGKQFVSTC